MSNETEFALAIKERFSKLPTVVQNAITSADVQKRLRELADKKKLHVDQWQSLENEVLLALIGVKSVENLEDSIKSKLGLMTDVAHELAEDISTLVFEPIRTELERQLEHPEAKEAAVVPVDAVKEQVLAGAVSQVETVQPASQAEPAAVQPATPPTPTPNTTVVRTPIAPASGDYIPGKASTERASVVDDPYREAPL